MRNLREENDMRLRRILKERDDIDKITERSLDSIEEYLSKTIHELNSITSIGGLPPKEVGKIIRKIWNLSKEINKLY